jgi:hypothetical protein
MNDCKFLVLAAILIFSVSTGFGQKNNRNSKKEVPVIIKNGVLYWAKDGKEVALFGVNYTAPFAYAYRAIQKTEISHEEAIRQDVYHFARLGFDAFRVHVWDTEISDTAGNLLTNHHLQLFDFLLAELKKYKIKSIITPIAFWGNGYPEQDENTPGFSRRYGKGKATTNDTAIRAQENYLQQFFKHVNPYTNLTYQQDPDIIATEINNEPNHSGSQQDVTDYINRLYNSIRTTGWSKPIFYNISENPRYASATTASKADGYSFQWYPSGLVGGRTLQNNYLPHVDTYRIPFGDSLPAFKNKPLMVYEFDPADIMAPIMYPAMARSFRAAGFQWATQFAYDPMAIAHANTEYQTHFLNLAYTPAKAISAMIAGEVFRTMPRSVKMNAYPADSVFGPFRLSYRQSLSEMNSVDKFYYTNSTETQPVNVAGLTHIAGTGNSPVVKYDGTGAYFLDKLEEGIWRLEIMPDAIMLSDPYAKTSPSKTIVAIQWQEQFMEIQLPSLGNDFTVKALNKGNVTNTFEGGGRFIITPGTYVLTAKGKNYTSTVSKGTLPLDAYYAPPGTVHEIHVNHTATKQMIAGKSYTIDATIAGSDIGKVSLLVSKPGWGRPTVIPMPQTAAYTHSGQIPAEIVTNGILQYRILVQSGDTYTTFPGNVKGVPFAWDYISGPSWETTVIDNDADISLYHAAEDKAPIVFPSWGRGIQQGIISTKTPGGLVYSYQSTQWPADGVVGLQIPLNNTLQTTGANAGSFTHVAIKAGAWRNEPLRCKLILITKDAIAFSAPVVLNNEHKELILSLITFQQDRYLLLPRPYPGFHPLWYGAAETNTTLTLSEIDVVQFVIEKEENTAFKDAGPAFEIEWISLRK